MLIAGFATALVASLLLVPLVRKLSFRLGRVAAPRADRWHRTPTPTLGGVAIYAAFLVAVLVTAQWSGISLKQHWGLLAGSAVIFSLGFIDDLKRITPPAKLLGQILAAAVVISLGYTTNFFTPKIPNSILAQLPNIVLTFIWLVGITNAINLLDNMDGLAGGIALIAAIFLSYFFGTGSDQGLFLIALALCGSLLGFLVFNFPPAKIFMGDSGSLFLGFTLAVLAIARQPQASNVFAVMGVPTLLFLLPILDTTLVTITRLMRGQSPAQGGKDHTSHRLIAFGLSERGALLVLYLVALLSGIAGIAIETLDYWLSLVFVPLLVVSLALLTAYLGRIKMVSLAPSRTGAFTRLMVDLAYKRRSLEIILDFSLIGMAYYLAFWTGGGFTLDANSLQLFLRTLPIAFGGAYLSFFVFGVYRGVWRYVGVDDLLRFARATLGGIVVLAMIIFVLFPDENYPREVFFLYAVFLFLGLAASRSTFKVLDLISGKQTRPKEQRVLIIGAGDAGEMAVRWILMNPTLGMRPVGFVDDDPFNEGRDIHGVGILGRTNQLDIILESKRVDGIVITEGDHLPKEVFERVVGTGKASGRWIRMLRLDFELVE